MGTEYYSIRSQSTGDLLYIHSSDNGDADCCGDRTYYLDYMGDEIYKADNYTTTLYASLHSTEWYNSTEERPKWYSTKIEKDTLEVVKVVETIEIESLAPADNMAPAYLDDLGFMLDYNALFDIQRTKDLRKTVFFMKGRKTDKNDFLPDRCIFRDFHIEKIVECENLPAKVISDKFFANNPNAFIFVTEPV